MSEIMCILYWVDNKNWSGGRSMHSVPECELPGMVKGQLA